MIENWHTTAVDEAAMVELGAKLATVLMKGSVVYLTGELGAGKTTFTRGFLRGLGHLGNVKSPTHGFVQSPCPNAGCDLIPDRDDTKN